tara:strand:+ start:1024 stop:1824 length:801 start_codon:yes stop_codon:yes gene_type:complete
MIINSKYNFLKPYKVKKLLRLGRNFDGGYLVCSDTLKKCENLVTLGVGDDISFEIDFEKKKNSKNIKLYDYTVNNLLFIKIIFKYFRRLITFRTSLNNFTYSIKNYLNFLKFLKKENVHLYKLRVVRKIKYHNDIDLRSIFKKINSNKNLLKIDIEGSEYEIINEIINYKSKIKMLIIEFHWINKNKKLFIQSVKKLKKNFDIIHIHANNYRSKKNSDDIFDVVELTMVNKKENQYHKNFRLNFPIKKLDYECFPHHKKIFFSFKN